MLSAFYEAMTGRGPDLLRAYFLAVAIQMLAVNALVGTGHLTATLPPFFGLLTAIGSVLYGMGMVLAVGCAGAILYRAGEGRLDYILASAGFGLGAWVSGRWLVEPIRRLLHGAGAPLGVREVLPVSPWILVPAAAGLLGVGIWLLAPGRRPHDGRWSWALTGSLIGFITVSVLVASLFTGHPIEAGAAQGGGSLASLLAGDVGGSLGYSVVFALGIVGGSFIASWLHGGAPSKPLRSEWIAHSLGGGLLMGFSAALVAGDNLLHGLNGVPLFAVGSLTFVAGMFLGVWIGIRLGWLR